jgi:hypothetical protein
MDKELTKEEEIRVLILAFLFEQELRRGSYTDEEDIGWTTNEIIKLSEKIHELRKK